LAVSDVFYFCEENPRLTVVIDHRVEAEAANEVAQRHITLRLKKKATVRDVLWELDGLSSPSGVQ
jgi:hypothetical protein